MGDARPGMLGLETALAVVVERWSTGLLDWAASPTGCPCAPARIGGLAGHGPPGRRGEPANLMLVDPAARWTVDPAALASRSRNTPYAGMELPAGWWRRSCAASRRCSTERRAPVTAQSAERCWCSRTAGPSAARPTARRGDVRRGGVHHRHDRLPGDPDRPVLPPAGRGADRPAHRQHRRQRRGRRVQPDLGRRLRGPRPGPDARPTGAPPAASRTSSPPGRRRHQRRRHPGADPAPARARRDAGRRVQRRRRPGRRCSQRVRQQPADGRRRPDRRGQHPRSRTWCRPRASSGSRSPRSTSASSATPAAPGRARRRPRTCCRRPPPLEDMLAPAPDGVFFCPTARATRPPPTHAVDAGQGVLDARGSRCSASASATRSSAARSGFGTYKLRFGHRGHQPAGARPGHRQGARSPRTTTASPSTRRCDRPTDTAFGAGRGQPRLPQRRRRRGPALPGRAGVHACSSTRRRRPARTTPATCSTGSST